VWYLIQEAQHLLKSRITQNHEITNREEREGREEATLNLVIRQLTKRFGQVPEEIRGAISVLPLPVMENLSEALLDFTSLNDLQVWLAAVEN
jgi:predicted transposase YdaD